MVSNIERVNHNVNLWYEQWRSFRCNVNLWYEQWRSFRWSLFALSREAQEGRVEIKKLAGKKAGAWCKMKGSDANVREVHVSWR